MTARDLLDANDPAAVARGMGRRELTDSCVQLRRMWPQPEGFERVVRAVIPEHLERNACDPWSRANALALLLDIGEHAAVTGRLIHHLGHSLGRGYVCTPDLRVAGRLLRERGRRNPARWVQGLADSACAGVSLSHEAVMTVIETLAETAQPHDDIDVDEIDEVELAALEVPIPVPGLDGTVIRPVKSRGQCDRFAHHLQNCASSYVHRVKSGATTLLGIEVDGTPVELIEVRPTDGHVVQWKGRRNCAPDTSRRSVVERLLVEQRLAVLR